MSQATLTRVGGTPGLTRHHDGVLVRTAIGFTAWAERWFPDAFIFVAVAVVIVAMAALTNGASPLKVSQAFGDGFWSLITFTMQMAFVAIGGYVVASSPPAQRLIQQLAAVPKNGSWRSRVRRGRQHSCLVAQLGPEPDLRGLLVRALAERHELRMDYRAAAAAAYLGLGATWAMGLSSSAAQLQANPASLPQAPAADHGRHPVHRDDLPVAVDRHLRGAAGRSRS